MFGLAGTLALPNKQIVQGGLQFLDAGWGRLVAEEPLTPSLSASEGERATLLGWGVTQGRTALPPPRSDPGLLSFIPSGFQGDRRAFP
jgi:hypothetical protein